MNIFYTHSDPAQCAKEHCNVHTNKMIIETAQILSTAHRVLDDNTDESLYKATHKNHPSNLWVRSTNNNYTWAYCLLEALSKCYKQRTGKDHNTWLRVKDVLSSPPINIECGWFSPPPYCGPKEYKKLDTKESYKYYLNMKFEEWQQRERKIKVEFYFGQPEWYEDGSSRKDL